VSGRRRTARTAPRWSVSTAIDCTADGRAWRWRTAAAPIGAPLPLAAYAVKRWQAPRDYRLLTDDTAA
jgi:hypothetical protein